MNKRVQTSESQLRFFQIKTDRNPLNKHGVIKLNGKDLSLPHDYRGNLGDLLSRTEVQAWISESDGASHRDYGVKSRLTYSPSQGIMIPFSEVALSAPVLFMFLSLKERLQQTRVLSSHFSIFTGKARFAISFERLGSFLSNASELRNE